MADSYHHQPLDQEQASIRVIHLLPSSSSEPIRCELRHTTISSEYDALSYEWGPIEEPKTILINGSACIVRRNLWDFLDFLRNRPITAPIWIDAICINQNDVRERNHQVGLMDQIYSKAAQVWVWLGLKAHLSPHLQDLFELSDPKREHLDVQTRVRIQIQKLRSSAEEWLPDILAVYEATYWARVWIIQECVLADSLTFVFGQYVVPENHFHAVAMELSNPKFLFPPKSFGTAIRSGSFYKTYEERL